MTTTTNTTALAEQLVALLDHAIVHDMYEAVDAVIGQLVAIVDNAVEADDDELAQLVMDELAERDVDTDEYHLYR